MANTPIGPQGPTGKKPTKQQNLKTVIGPQGPTGKETNLPAPTYQGILDTAANIGTTIIRPTFWQRIGITTLGILFLFFGLFMIAKQNPAATSFLNTAAKKQLPKIPANAGANLATGALA